MSLLRDNLSYYYQFIKIKKTSFFKEPWIFVRCACLGNDVLENLQLKYTKFNFQKCRADYVIKFLEDKKLSPHANYIAKYMQRKDIIPLIFQQKLIRKIFELHPPEIIFVDSYSELTDQLFMHKKNRWLFSLNYTDLDINHPKVWNVFERKNLLPIQDIQDYYRKFFEKLRSQFGETPIVFIHFPTKLDKRAKFIQRGEAIKSAIINLKSSFKPFYEISADDSVVEFDGVNNFPYHYNKETYKNISDKIKSLKLCQLK